MSNGLDDKTEEILKDENPTAEAIKSLITVKDRETGKASEIELKTDLDTDEIKIHTVLDLLSNVLEMDTKNFSKKCILADLINRKERKALSKDRKSRGEIVSVAKPPEFPMQPQELKKEGFIRRFFTSRKET